jgi:hypothetical protein
MADLSPFEGRDVITTRIAITNAGDGLYDALAVEPNEMHLGETVYVVLQCEVAKIRHDPVKDTDGLARVHTLKAGTGTIVDAGLVQDVIADQARRNQLERNTAGAIIAVPRDLVRRLVRRQACHASQTTETARIYCTLAAGHDGAHRAGTRAWLV